MYFAGTREAKANPEIFTLGNQDQCSTMMMMIETKHVSQGYDWIIILEEVNQCDQGARITVIQLLMFTQSHIEHLTAPDVPAGSLHDYDPASV